jgi:glucose-6-phosphate isomerase
MKVNLDYAKSFIKPKVFEKTLEDVKKAHQSLKDKTILGHEFLGWVPGNPLPESVVDDIISVAEHIQKEVDVLVVIGIGGSYLGAKAAMDALSPYFKSPEVEVIFAGHHLSGAYLEGLLEYLDDKQFAINVISKSGTTTEPALAFRLLKDVLVQKVGIKKAQKLIVATTDPKTGALRKLADQEGYQTFEVPSDIGGRFSVFSAVGILPMAVSGIDVKAFLKGAKDAAESYEKNPEAVYDYATIRQSLYRSGKKFEIFVHFEPKLHFTAEWLKQLFGESEGKEEQGLYVTSAGFSTDLHSLGQIIQEGEKIFFETVLNIEEALSDIKVPLEGKNLDGLNYLADQTFEFVNEKAMEATRLAHVDGNVPNIRLSMSKLDPYEYGAFLYFFCLVVALSGAASGVNPFNQPGVEAYKVNMFALLGKPGFEKEKEALLKR